MNDDDLIRRKDALTALDAVWRTMIGGAEVQRKVNASIRAIPAADAREAAAVVLDAMNDGEVWGRAVNAAMPIINADLDQSAWVTVSEVREALVAALRALIDEARDD